MGKDSYVLAAFSVDQARSLKYQRYKTVIGVSKGVADALLEKADYISIRRIRGDQP